MRFLALLFVSAVQMALSLGACRMLSMTFQPFGFSIAIKNNQLAAVLIAYKNTWGIAADTEKRNQMSLLGVVSYIVFFPQAGFLVHNIWMYFTAGLAEVSEAEKTYLILAGLYYMIAVGMKLKEADNFQKGKIR